MEVSSIFVIDIKYNSFDHVACSNRIFSNLFLGKFVEDRVLYSGGVLVILWGANPFWPPVYNTVPVFDRKIILS